MTQRATTRSDREAEQQHLRIMIEQMARSVASEREIEQAVREASADRVAPA